MSALCRIENKPEEWQLHTVFVEEESDGSVYTMYRLLYIQKDGICSLYNPQTEEYFTSSHLRGINIECLIILWERYLELYL